MRRFAAAHAVALVFAIDRAFQPFQVAD